MLVGMLLTKHQVRDPRTSWSTSQWIDRWSTSFVDPFSKLGLLLLCILPFYLPGKIQVLIGHFFQPISSDIGCCWWETSSSIESFRSTWRIIWSWNGFDLDVFGLDIRKIDLSSSLQSKEFSLKFLQNTNSTDIQTEPFFFRLHFFEKYAATKIECISPSLDYWKDQKTVAMTLLCGEEPLLLLRRGSEILISWPISLSKMMSQTFKSTVVVAMILFYTTHWARKFTSF